MDESEPMEPCDNCGKLYPESKVTSHFSYCRRNIKRCEKCNEFIDINYKDEHDQDYHSKQKCKMCEKEFSPEQFSKHQNVCPKRPKYCQFCELNIAVAEFDRHVATCGSRTKICTKCNKNIMLRDYDVHFVTCVPAPSLPRPSPVEPPVISNNRISSTNPPAPPVSISYGSNAGGIRKPEPETFMYKPRVTDQPTINNRVTEGARGNSRNTKPQAPVNTYGRQPDFVPSSRQEYRIPARQEYKLPAREQPRVPAREEYRPSRGVPAREQYQPSTRGAAGIKQPSQPQPPTTKYTYAPTTAITNPREPPIKPTVSPVPVTQTTKSRAPIFQNATYVPSTNPTANTRNYNPPATSIPSTNNVRREPERTRPSQQAPRYNPADYLPPQDRGGNGFAYEDQNLSNEEMELQKAIMASMESQSTMSKEMEQLGIQDMSQSFYRDVMRQKELQSEFSKKAGGRNSNNNPPPPRRR